MARPPTNSTAAPTGASSCATVPRQAGGECVEAHEFLKPALNENAADHDPSEQAEDIAPGRGAAVDPRLIGNDRAAGALIGPGSTRYSAHGLPPMRSTA